MTVISDEVCLAALRGWCNAPPDFQFSPYQQSAETKAAWRRAILAALVALGVEPPGPTVKTPDFDSGNAGSSPAEAATNVQK